MAGEQTILFISRAGEEQEIAAAVRKILVAAGYRVLLQEVDFLNRSIMQKMHDALKRAKHVIALLSPSYLKSEYCEAEWQNTIAKDPLNKRGRLIVMRAAECEPEGMLSAIAYWDLLPVREDTEALRERVLLAVRANPWREDFDAPSFFYRPTLQLPPPGSTLHSKVLEVPGFTGRDAELEALETALWTKGGAAALTNSRSSAAAVRGLGGVGKTTLARQYASRMQKEYYGVWWLEAEKRGGRLDQLITGLIDLGEKLMPGMQSMQDREKTARAVLDLIEEASFETPWLLVYDNVENPRDLDDWTPRKNAHVLITTRWPDWEGQAAELPIDVFTPEVAIEFLMAHRPKSGPASIDMRAAAGELAAKLGYLPLALDHARTYCKRVGKTFEEYGAQLPELIKKAPKGAVYPNAVFATFELAMEKASGRGAETKAGGPVTPAEEGCPEAETLMSMVAFMAPDSIPLSVVTPDVMSSSKRDDAVEALTNVSLIKVGQGNIGMHRLVQEVARTRQGPQARDRSLDSLVKSIAAVYPNDPWGLFPHVLEVLQVLGKEEYQDSAARDFLDRLTRVVIMGLRTADSKQKGRKVVPEHIATLIGDFYEVDPLKSAIALLLSDYRYAWPKIQKQLLDKNSYALRYAMAISLADAACQEPPLMTVEEIAGLIQADNDLNEFELGGYALTLVYARKPELIYTGKPNPEVAGSLRKLAERREMPGRSIVGDFLLNLMFRSDIGASVKPRELVTSEKFWHPVWEHIKIDVCAIEAAEAFNAKPRRPISKVSPEARAAYRSLETVEKLWKDTQQSHHLSDTLRSLLEDYFSLGQHISRVHDVQDELGQKSKAELKDFMRLVFLHPIWATGEAAATVLSVLAEEDRKRLEIISELFDDKEWRVQMGASAAAYYVRNIDNAELFFESVVKFHTHNVCWVRGMAAEHLVAHILGSSNIKRDELLVKFKKVIQHWLATEEDCWVFDHVFRLFNTLHGKELAISWLFPPKLTPLLKGAPEWYSLSRDQMLGHIEGRKEELVRADSSALSRLARSVWTPARWLS